MTDTGHRNRQPKGSPAGGEFAAEAGAEATTGLTAPTPENIAVVEDEFAAGMQTFLVSTFPDVFRGATSTCQVEITHTRAGIHRTVTYGLQFEPNVGPVERHLAMVIFDGVVERLNVLAAEQ